MPEAQDAYVRYDNSPLERKRVTLPLVHVRGLYNICAFFHSLKLSLLILLFHLDTYHIVDT